MAKYKTREYSIWLGMKDRCSRKKHVAYEYYGGRGIKVCERWMIFENFLSDMGRLPSETHSIERRNNDGGYSPENCYWATKKEQGNNTSRNIYIEYNGDKKTLKQWCDHLGLNYKRSFYRWKYGKYEIDRLFDPARVY